MQADDQWAEYLRLQRQADASVLSDRYWAIDEALAALLDKIEHGHPIAAREPKNLIANRAAKHRSRRQSLMQNMELLGNPSVSDDARFEAQRELERHQAHCTHREWRVLVMIGLGHTYAYVAKTEEVPEATVKTWVRRSRVRLAA